MGARAAGPRGQARTLPLVLSAMNATGCYEWGVLRSHSRSVAAV